MMTRTRVAPVPSGGLLGLRVGELVEVRSANEILAGLDERGELDGLPFMPEMVPYCGRRLTVHKVAHKVCDTISRSGMRRMSGAVYLTGARCDGAAHGGCQTACQFLWREQWLRRVDVPEAPAVEAIGPEGNAHLAEGRLELLPLTVANSVKEPGPDGEPRWSCQATELLRAAPSCLPFHDLTQYVDDVRSGNVGVWWAARAFLVGLFNRLQHHSTKVLPPSLQFRQGLRWRFLKGGVVGRTPSEELDLQPGEWVRVKSKEQILATLDGNLLNRGMGFDEEMSRFCGQAFRVQARVQRCIEESSGRMLTMKYPCIVLENNVCAGAFNVSCPREFVPFWREVWLERISS